MGGNQSIPRILGKPKTVETPLPTVTPLSVINTISLKINDLKIHIKHKTKLKDTEHSIAQEYLKKGDKAQATRSLQKVKRYEETIAGLLRNQTLLEVQLAAVENQITQNEVINTMKDVKNVLNVNKASTTEVEDIMESIQDNMEATKDISAALSEPLVDEADVSEELESMMKELTPEPPKLMISIPAVTENSSTESEEERVALPA